MLNILQHVSIAIAEVAVSSTSVSWVYGLALLVVGRSLWSAADHVAALITAIPAKEG